MADKPKYQNELAERLASMARCLSLEFAEEQPAEEGAVDLPPALLYLRAFWETMCREWRGIDRLRLNKYYYLMKQFLSIGFELVEKADFDRDFTCVYFGILQKFPLNVRDQKIPAALKIHTIENFVEGLRSLGVMFDEGLSIIMLSPLFEALSSAEDKIILKSLDETFTKIIVDHAQYESAMEVDQNEEECGEDEDEEVSGEEEEEGEGEEEEDGSEEDHSASDEEDEEDEDVFDLSLFTETLFSMGAEPEIKDANRKILYKLSELFKPFESQMEECENGCSCSLEHGDDHDHEHGHEGEEDESMEEVSGEEQN